MNMQNLNQRDKIIASLATTLNILGPWVARQKEITLEDARIIHAMAMMALETFEEEK